MSQKWIRYGEDEWITNRVAAWIRISPKMEHRPSPRSRFTAIAAYSTASGIGHNSRPLTNPVPAIGSSAKPSRSASNAVSIPIKRKTDASPAPPPGRTDSDEAESEEFRGSTGIVPLRECALARVLRGIEDPLKARCVFRHNGSFCLLMGDRVRRRTSGRGSMIEDVAAELRAPACFISVLPDAAAPASCWRPALPVTSLSLDCAQLRQ